MVTLERIPALDQLQVINHTGTSYNRKNRNLCVIYVPMLYVVQKIFKLHSRIPGFAVRFSIIT